MKLNIGILVSFILAMFGAHYWATIGPYIMDAAGATPKSMDLHMYSFHLSFAAGCIVFMKTQIWKLWPLSLWPILLVASFGLSFLPLEWWELTIIRSVSGIISAALFYYCFEIIKHYNAHSFIPVMYSVGSLVLEGAVFISGLALEFDLILVAACLPIVIAIPLILLHGRTTLGSFEIESTRNTLLASANESGPSIVPLMILNIICHCAFFYLLLKLGHVFSGANASVYIGTAVLVMAPSFSLGAFISGWPVFKDFYWTILSLLISIIGIVALFQAFATSVYIFGIIGTGLFAIGNGMTLSKLVYELSVQSKDRESYPVKSMSMVMLATSVLGLTAHLIQLDPILLIGSIYACCLFIILVSLLANKYRMAAS